MKLSMVNLQCDCGEARVKTTSSHDNKFNVRSENCDIENSRGMTSFSCKKCVRIIEIIDSSIINNLNDGEIVPPVETVIFNSKSFSKDKIYQKELGQRLKIHLDKRKIKPSDFAKKHGIGTTRVTNWFREMPFESYLVAMNLLGVKFLAREK